MQTALSKLKGTDVRFGSKADMCGAKRYVRFAPESDRESRHQKRVMSALHPIADMCGATAHVGFGPIADMGCLFDYIVGTNVQRGRNINA
jgi:hypothetical protein